MQLCKFVLLALSLVLLFITSPSISQNFSVLAQYAGAGGSPNDAPNGYAGCPCGDTLSNSGPEGPNLQAVSDVDVFNYGLWLEGWYMVANVGEIYLTTSGGVGGSPGDFEGGTGGSPGDPAPSGGALPNGWFDGADCSAFSGWSCDGDNYAAPLTVRFWEGGILKAMGIANITREQAVADSCGGNPAHGFTVAIPSSLKDSNPHSITADVLDDGGTDAVELNGNPKSITCSPPPPNTPNYSPVGDHNSASCNVNTINDTGWACDQNDWNSKVTIHFYLDGPAGTGTFIGAADANQWRGDDAGIAAQCGSTGSHAYNFTSGPVAYGTHTVYAYAINTPPGNNVLLAGVGKTATCTASPVTLSGRINKVTDDGLVTTGFSGVTLNPGGICVIGSTTADGSGNFSYANVPYGTSFCMRGSAITGYTGPLANYECQTAGQSLGSVVCGSGSVLDQAADNAYNFTYTLNPPSAPTVTVNSCVNEGAYYQDNQVVSISWTNPGIPVTSVDVSSDPNFGTFWYKTVSGTSVTPPTLQGFNNYWNGSSFTNSSFSALQGVTYYVRLYNGSHSPQTSSTNFAPVKCTPAWMEVDGDVHINQ